jgi:phosphoribosylamine--glycine ligase
MLARQEIELVNDGGRVLGITVLADSVKLAQNRAYDAIHKIDWPEGFYRKDIGWRATEYESRKATA